GLEHQRFPAAALERDIDCDFLRAQNTLDEDAVVIDEQRRLTGRWDRCLHRLGRFAVETHRQRRTPGTAIEFLVVEHQVYILPPRRMLTQDQMYMHSILAGNARRAQRRRTLDRRGVLHAALLGS